MQALLIAIGRSSLVCLILVSAISCHTAIAPDSQEMRPYYAAKSFADTLWESGTPQHAEAFRKALEVASQAYSANSITAGAETRALFLASPTIQTGLLATDPRYQSNLLEGTYAAMQNVPTLTGRIWGGTPTGPEAYQATVALKGDQYICSGVYIGQRKILTAAHCLCDDNGKPRKDEIRRAVFDHKPAFSTNVVPIERGKSKAMSQCPIDLTKGDIALLVMKDDPRTPVMPAVLANTKQINGARVAYLVGYGEAKAAGLEGASGVLRRVAGAHVASSNCLGSVEQQSDSGRYGCVAGLELVAGEVGSNIDTCNGDSGGPIFLLGDGEIGSGGGTKQEILLAAITSRKVREGRRCGDGGIYVRVDGQVSAWITENSRD